MSHTMTHALRRTARGLFKLGAVLSLLLIDTGTADARLNPYHVVRAGGGGGGATRILVIVDTSGTMSAAADGSSDVCVFNECEDTSTPSMSRIAAARYAIRQVVEATDGLAEFGFIGFQRGELGGDPQDTCGGSRFRWVTQASSLSHPAAGNFDANIHGYPGVWELCSDHEAFPYVRYDQARFGVTLSNNIGDPLPSTPVGPIDEPTFSNAWHQSRRVQFFEDFHGIRFVPTSDDWDASDGDYSEGATTGNVFYYWPYVDGFPGYTDFDRGGASSELGVNGALSLGTNPFELYGPFYVTVDPALLNTNYDGPTSVEEARDRLLETLSSLPEGGVDVAADATFSWDNAIGSTNSAPLNSASILSSTNLDRYLTWHANALEEMGEDCADTAVIIISDGINGWDQPSRAYYRMAEIYRDLGVPAYVIGFNSVVSTELNGLACAATGACDGGPNSCATPCDDASATAWETCQDASDPENSCVWAAEDPNELAIQLANIVAQILDVDVDAGQGAIVNNFGVGGVSDQYSQTSLSARTDVGTWQGHVTRGYCTDVDEMGVLQDYCQAPAPEFDLPTEAIDTFGGPCPQSRAWDAGECLQSTPWTDRRLFTHTADNDVIAIAEADGSATTEFYNELDAQGLLTDPDPQAQADAIVEFVLGANAPDDWKLPGVANSSPIVVRRVPEYNPDQIPEVPIRDPHCGGRYYSLFSAGELPQSLYDFAESANDDANKIGAVPDFEYQEAVLVGDDMGVLHAFQLDSGNELWGFIPRGVWANLVAQASNGVDNMGQPLEIDEHIFGIATTVNHAFVHDDGPDGAPNTADDDWVHLAVFGLGAGGTEWETRGTPGVEVGAEYYALDISHMNPDSPQGPIEILWTTEDATLKADYDPILGQTWARPAITYHVPNEAISSPPDAFLVMGSGYAVDGTAEQGRTLVRADALTGAIVESVPLPEVTHTVYEDDFGSVVDIAIGSHCLSRFWAESQEAYIADPAGRLFRWDLGRDTAHEADSGGLWSALGEAATIDSTTPFFGACTGAGDTCTVDPAVGDSFLYPAGVSANDRIDDSSALAAGEPPGGEDQFLIALISGSSYETELDGYETGLDFHSSIYLLVDDHTGADKTVGFDIPAGAPKSVTAAAGGSDLSGVANEQYFRIALSDIERERIPYPGATPEVRTFSRETRPIRAPRIVVVGAVDTSGGTPEVIDGIEVYFVEFTVYEPPTNGCNVDLVDDPSTPEVEEDLGSSYVLRFRLTADSGSGFNLITGTDSAAVDFGGGFSRGLTLESVDQITAEDGSGNAGPISSQTGGLTPCEADEPPGLGSGASNFAATITHKELSAFTPVE